MKKIILTAALVASGYGLWAQDAMGDVLQQIEENNTTLEALRWQTEADEIGTRTGLAPANPEVEFNYLWGNPTPIGNRTDIAVRQSFDFPSAYVYRGRIARLEGAGVELQYKARRIELLSEARNVCIELIYCNARLAEQDKRMDDAAKLAESYVMMFERGEAGVIEKNRAMFNYTARTAETARLILDRDNLLNELRRLNGGKDISFRTDDFPLVRLPGDFEQWYAQAEEMNPMLQYIRSQVDAGHQQVRLDRAMGMPKISAGYMSEKVVGERFQGVTLGITVPLWENKNRVRQAKVEARAREVALEDSRTQFYVRLQGLYGKVQYLLGSAAQQRGLLAEYSNYGLLRKALDGGQISLQEYILGMQEHYEAVDRVLEADKEAQLAYAELSAVEL